jgi:hypothetical protein
MTKRILLPTVLVGMLSMTQAFAEDPTPATVKNQVDAFIASTTKKAQANQMQASANKYIVGDVNGDGHGDLVLYYDLLGPTFSLPKLAVFTNEKGKLRLASEIDLDGEVQLDSVKNGKIMVSGKKLGPKDPRCCPSVPYKKSYSLKSKKLVETKP